MQKSNRFSDALIDEAYRLASHFRSAEVVPDQAPQWLVVTAVTGQEQVAAAHLIGRRFGVYLPEIEVRQGRSNRLEFMFPGHLFVFSWAVNEHWARITACPGVLEIIGTLPDSEVRRIQAVENEHRPLKGVRTRRPHKKGFRRGRDETVIDEIVAVRSWSAFTDGIETLDSEGRNDLLHRALSLPEVPCPEGIVRKKG